MRLPMRLDIGSSVKGGGIVGRLGGLGVFGASA